VYWYLPAAWILFGGSHIVMTSKSVRPRLVHAFTENGYRALFSLVAFVTFGLLIWSYTHFRNQGALIHTLNNSTLLVSLNGLLMLAAFLFLIPGLMQKNPMGMIAGEPQPRGITRITRHPMNMAFACFGLAHMAVLPFASDWIFLGGLVIFAFASSVHQDSKKKSDADKKMNAFITQTSIIPFVAIISGRQKLVSGEFHWPQLLIAVIATVIARGVHFL